MTSERRIVVVAALTALFVLLVHALALPAQALTDDDDFYAPAAIRYADWLGELFTSPRTALSVSGIDAGFGLNHEHPPFAKLVMGLVHHVGSALGFGVLDSVRLGTACFVVVMAFVLVRWLYKPLGPVVAVGSVVVLLSLPRFFLHSEVATLDVPVAAMIVIVTAAFERARDKVGAGLVVGVLFGLATATKLNAPFAVLPLVVVTLLERWRGFGIDDVDGKRDLASLRLPAMPPSLWWMASVGPLVFVLVWPWLWPDLLPRIGAYIAFHLRHYPIYLFYDGEIWDKPFAPGMASVVLGFGSVPVVVVVAAAIGAVRALGSLRQLVAGSSSSSDRVLALVLLQAAMSVAVVAVSDVPRYGGEKLFMPLFPFLAVLAAVGAKAVADVVAAWLPLVVGPSSLDLTSDSPLVAGSSNLDLTSDSPLVTGSSNLDLTSDAPLVAGPSNLDLASDSPLAHGVGAGGRGGEGTNQRSNSTASSTSASPNAEHPHPQPLCRFAGEGRKRRACAARTAPTVVVFVALLVPGVVGIANTWGGYGLSYYGELVGGLRGAVARGHERTYYDLADKELAQTLDRVAAGKRVHVEPNHKEYLRTWRWLRKDGVISRDGFVIEGNFEAADVVVLMHERRWKTYPALRERVRGWKVLAEKRVDGVLLWSVSSR